MDDDLSALSASHAGLGNSTIAIIPPKADLARHQPKLVYSAHNRPSLPVAVDSAGITTHLRPGRVLSNAVPNISVEHEDESVSQDPSLLLSDLNSNSSILVHDRQALQPLPGNQQRKPSRANINKASTSSSNKNLTLREQEKVIDDVKKENFSLKLKVYFLEERLSKLAPDQLDAAIKESIEMKVEAQTLKTDLKKTKRLLLEATKALEEKNGRENGVEKAKEESLQSQLREKDREILQLRETASRSTSRSQFSDNDTATEISRLRDELDAERDAREDLLAAQDQFKDQLEFVNATLEDAQDDLRRYEKLHGRLPPASGRSQSVASSTRVGSRQDFRSSKSGSQKERDQLYDEIDRLNSLNASLHASTRTARGQTDAYREKEAEANSYRDRLSATLLESEKHQMRAQDLENEMHVINVEWQEEYDKVSRERDELNEALEKVESEVNKLDQEHAQVLRASSGKDNKIASLNREVKTITDDLMKLERQISELEAELEDKAAHVQELEEALDNMEHDRNQKQESRDEVAAKLADYDDQHDQLLRENADLNEERQRLEQALQREQEELDQKTKQLRTHQSKIDSLTSELTDAQQRIHLQEADIASLNNALKSAESAQRSAGKSQSLEVDVQRLKRELEAAEMNLNENRAQMLATREDLRIAQLELADTRSKNDDLTSQLSQQTRNRLTLNDKLESATKALTKSQADVAHLKDKLASIDKAALSSSKNSTKMDALFKSQLDERNSLLSSVLQSVSKMADAGASPRKGTADPKPSSNFSTFSETLLARLKVLSDLKSVFEARLRDVESSCTGQVDALKKQQDTRLRQLDRIENAIKAASEVQRQWRQRLVLKQTELDAAKATNSELTAQLASVKSQIPSSDGASPGSNTALQQALGRASTAEKNLALTTAQLRKVEDKLNEGRDKIEGADMKWEARLKELEMRQRASEEKVKRERQGAKERINELQKDLHRAEEGLAQAERRRHNLEELLAQYQAHN